MFQYVRHALLHPTGAHFLICWAKCVFRTMEYISKGQTGRWEFCFGTFKLVSSWMVLSVTVNLQAIWHTQHNFPFIGTKWMHLCVVDPHAIRGKDKRTHKFEKWKSWRNCPDMEPTGLHMRQQLVLELPVQPQWTKNKQKISKDVRWFRRIFQWWQTSCLFFHSMKIEMTHTGTRKTVSPTPQLYTSKVRFSLSVAQL